MKKKKKAEAKRELLPVAWQRFSSAETCANAREQSGFCLPQRRRSLPAIRDTWGDAL